MLDKKVIFCNDCVGKEVEETVNGVTDEGIVLLENLRFHAEEEGSSKDSEGKKVKADKGKVEDFRKGLTALGDIYVNDAFGTAHRAHRYVHFMGSDLAELQDLVANARPKALWSASNYHRKHQGS